MTDMNRTTQIFEGQVVHLVAEISMRVFARIDNGFHFNKVEAHTVDEVLNSADEFRHRNPVGTQLIHNILDEVTYNPRYLEIGESLIAVAPDGFADDIGSPQEFGKKVIEANVVYAVIQKVSGFAEIDFHIVHTSSLQEAELYNKEVEEINAMMEKIVLKRAKYFAKHYVPSADISTMTFAEFHKYFNSKAKLDGTQEHTIGIHAMGKLMGNKGAELSAMIVSLKLKSGEISFVDVICNMDEIGKKITFEMLVTSLSVYHQSIVHGIPVEDIDVQGIVFTLAK